MEDLHEFKEGLALPFHGVGFGDLVFEKVFEKLELRDETRDESAEEVEEELELVGVVLDKVEDALDEQFGLLPVGKVDGIDILVTTLERLGNEDFQEVDGDAGVLRQPSRVLFDQLVNDVDRLEFDLVENLRRQLRGRHAWEMPHRHVHQLSRVATE